MITKMLKMQVIALKSDINKLISALHNLGVAHIEYTEVPKDLDRHNIKHILLDETEIKERQRLEEIIRKTEGILSKIKTGCTADISGVYKEIERLSTAELYAGVSDLENLTSSAWQKKNRLAEEAMLLLQYRKIIESFLNTPQDLSGYKDLKDLESIALIFPKKYESQMKYFHLLIEEKIKHKVDIYLSDFDKKKVVALMFYEKKYSAAIDAEIFKKGTQKITLPEEFMGRTAKEVCAFIDGREKEIQEEVKECDRQAGTALDEKYCFLQAVKAVGLGRVEELLVKQNFVESKFIVSIMAWLPEKLFNDVKNSLTKQFGNGIIINDVTATVQRREEIPVLLENPEAIKPFELLLSILQPPKYGTTDSTKLLAIFFPLFFGLIVGDAGYGLVLLLISLLLKRAKKPALKSISKLISYVAVSTIAFGFLFAEIFGSLGMRIFHIHPILFHRQEDIVAFLVLAISIGLFHITLGLILGIQGAIKLKHNKEILEKTVIIVSLFALFSLVAVLAGVIHKGFFVPSVALLTVSIPVLIYAGGILAPLEVISTLANVLSYARIMALGVAGVMMAHVANTFGGLIEDVWVGIIIAGLIHILNIALSVFSPTIQSLRLHYVEFFSKFYEPGGKKYVPFKKKGVVECIP